MEAVEGTETIVVPAEKSAKSPKPKKAPKVEPPPFNPMGHYLAAELNNPGVLIAIRVGDFYEFYGEAAKTAAEALEITLTSREQDGEKVPMSGVPFHSVEKYLAVLLQKGHKVALLDLHDDTADSTMREFALDGDRIAQTACVILESKKEAKPKKAEKSKEPKKEQAPAKAPKVAKAAEPKEQPAEESPADPETWREYAVKVLREHGYRITGPRVAVVRAFENATAPVTPYRIKEWCDTQDLQIDTVSVYRIMQAMVACDLIIMVSTLGYIKRLRKGEHADHMSLVFLETEGSISELAIGAADNKKLLDIVRSITGATGLQTVKIEAYSDGYIFDVLASAVEGASGMTGDETP